MKRFWVLTSLMLLLAGCKNSSPPAKTPEEPEAIALTRWTEKTELFMEHPPLVAGQNARFAVHLTDLRSFKALTEGRVTVELRAANGRAETFQTDAPSRPGIFGLNVKPSTAGSYLMTVRLDSAALKDTHEAGPVEVYANAQAAAEAPKAEEVEAISFLKEQQWTLDFATEPVWQRELRESIRVPGEIRPRTGGEAEVTAPVTGRLTAASAVPAVGTFVSKGQTLALLMPATSTPADRATLEAAVSEARSSLELARRDRGRTERLLATGAIPAKRHEEARAAEAMAEARLSAAEARLAQHESTRRAEGGGGPDSAFLLRAPLSGVVAEVDATTGGSVEAGEKLFRVVATDTVYVVASVPEAEVHRLRQLTGAELEIPGRDGRLAAARLVSIGRVIDPRSRTLPVVYEIANADRLVAVGQSLFVRLFTSTKVSASAVAETAIVDDAGRPVVFVQVGGESFARRAVRLGNREGGYVHVLEGVRPGERVVMRGAYQIRLAALSTQIPAHGHVH